MIQLQNGGCIIKTTTPQNRCYNLLHTFCGLSGEVPSVHRTFPWLQILAAKPGWKWCLTHRLRQVGSLRVLVQLAWDLAPQGMLRVQAGINRVRRGKCETKQHLDRSIFALWRRLATGQLVILGKLQLHSLGGFSATLQTTEFTDPGGAHIVNYIGQGEGQKKILESSSLVWGKSAEQMGSLLCSTSLAKPNNRISAPKWRVREEVISMSSDETSDFSSM